MKAFHAHLLLCLSFTLFLPEVSSGQPASAHSAQARRRRRGHTPPHHTAPRPGRNRLAPAAAPPEDNCKLQPDAPELIDYLPEDPSWFSNITADGRYAFVIGHNSNFITDLNSGGTSVRVPGPYDPVPAPPLADGRVHHFTVPNPDLLFYSVDEAISRMEPGQMVDNRSMEPINTFPTSGVYQSMGLLKEENGRPTYRVLSGDLSIRDFEQGADGKFTEKPSGFNCPHDQGQYKLPMLAKNGKEFATFDTTAGVTKIFKIEDDGSCKEEMNLGLATGKVNFAYDGKAITFHTDTFDKSNQGDMFDEPAGTMAKNVYVMKLNRHDGAMEPGEMKRLTMNTKPGNNSYYPSFTADGRIMYIHGETGADGNVRFSLRRVDPKLSNAPQINYLSPTNTCTVGTASSYALGDLMQRLCKGLVHNQTLEGGEAAVWSLGLDPDACKRLVDKNWDGMANQIKHDDSLLRSNKFGQRELSALSKDAVKEACPKGHAAVRPHPVIMDTTDNGPSEDLGTPQEFFQRRCISCHTGDHASRFDWNALTLTQVNKMLIAIQSGTMPQGFLRNREEALQPLVQELLRRQADLEEQASHEVN